MAAISINTNQNDRAVRYLESIAYTNTQTDVKKAVKVPGWARFLSFYLFVTSTGGTTPSIALSLLVPDFSTIAKFSAPTDDNESLLADAAAITAITGAGPYVLTYDIGPGVTGIADDVTGAAAADSRVAVNTVLPPWVVYNLDFHTDVDEDYTLQLVAQFRG